jgi:hypothetical protein
MNILIKFINLIKLKHSFLNKNINLFFHIEFQSIFPFAFSDLAHFKHFNSSLFHPIR